MDKKTPSSEKKRSLFWIVLIVLIMMMGALGWQAKSLLQKPDPTPAPSTVWAKVPPAPAPTTIQIPQPTPNATMESQDTDDSGPETDSTESNEIVTSEQSDVEQPSPGAATDHTSAIKESAPIISTKKDIEKEISKPADEAVQAAKEKTEALTPPSDAPSTADEPETTEPAPAEAVTPATAPKPSADPEIEKQKQAPYTIQVGAFRVKTHAMDTKAKLSRKGYQSYIYETTGANKKLWYAVRFGHFETRDQANQALSDFKTKEKMDGMVTRSNAL